MCDHWTKDHWFCQCGQCCDALNMQRKDACINEDTADGPSCQNALPTNSSSSSSSSPFSESICMASSMKLTALPAREAELCSLPNAPPRDSFSLRRVKYCSANSSRSPGWFLRTSTVKLCRSSVKPSGISILISWRWNVRKIRPGLARIRTTTVGPVSPRQLRRMTRKTRQRERDGFLAIPPSACISHRVRPCPLICGRKNGWDFKSWHFFSLSCCWLQESRACDAGNHGNQHPGICAGGTRTRRDELERNASS